MKRPWQIWLVYAVGLSALVGAFAWLTIKALELDRAEMLARRQAEREEDISRALWRMDALLTPLLAEEAARPESVYRAVNPTRQSTWEKGTHSKDTTQQELSPLLAAPPDYVLLHFAVHPDGQVSSPQCPTGEDNAWALRNGISPESVTAAATRLAALKPVLSHAALLAKLPLQRLPTDWLGLQGIAPSQNSTELANTPVIANTYEGIEQQQKVQNAEPTPSQPQPNPPFGNPAGQQPAPQKDLQQAASQGGFGGQQLDSSPLNFGANVDGGRLQRQQSRAGNDLVNREAALQAYAQKQVVEQRSNLKTATPLARVVEGVSRPLWLGDRLLLARRVQVGDETVIQGCWLDWPRLKERLKAEVADLLPDVELTPWNSGEPIRVLAAIPVQLSLPPLAAPLVGWTPIRVSLVVAWGCLLVTAVAAAMMLHGVVTLSERRGAFVSAVTHELRTPLTTFRMYAEMLSAGMVSDAAKQQQYLETLRIEADRLAHLVENVLQYARLERGRPGQCREVVALSGLLDRCRSRLAERAAQAEMQLAIELPEQDCEAIVATDSAAVEQILFNLVDNACKYAVQADDKRIHLSLAGELQRVKITVRDHGPGISAAGQRKLFQPFSKSVHEAANTAPGVGLGLALSRRLAAELGGRLELQSPADGGAAFVLTLPRRHR